MTDVGRSFTDLRTYHDVGPSRITSGLGALATLPALLRRHATKRSVLVTTRSLDTGAGLVNELKGLLEPSLATTFSDCRQHAPESSVAALTQCLRMSGADMVVAAGGSSVFDVCKLAALRTRAEAAGPDLRWVAVPTTLSAGEFNPSAGTTNGSSHEKSYVFDRRMLPVAVVLDPSATIQTPDTLWLSTGIKAIEHAIESVWDYRAAHPVVDTLALQAIALLAEHLEPSRSRAATDHRGACQIAAWMSMASVSTHGLRLSHLIGHQVGACWDIPHGITACVLLPAVLRFLGPSTNTEQRRIGTAFGLDLSMTPDPEVPEEVASAMEAFIRRLGLPASLNEAGARRSDIEQVAASSYRAAEELRLTLDLPLGPKSVRQVLEEAW